MTVLDCVNSFEKLLSYEYKFILGHKNKTREINLCFEKTNCFHLIGLQHLADLRSIKLDREKVFENIKNGQFDQNLFESSRYYNTIKERINFLPYLEQMLDSNKTIFKYNSYNRQFSMIEADFLMKNEINARNVFLFLSECEDSTDHYFCRSFFPQDKIDYSLNQTSWTLLYKSKKNLETGKVEVLFQNPNFKMK